MDQVRNPLSGARVRWSARGDGMRYSQKLWNEGEKVAYLSG